MSGYKSSAIHQSEGPLCTTSWSQKRRWEGWPRLDHMEPRPVRAQTISVRLCDLIWCDFALEYGRSARTREHLTRPYRYEQTKTNKYVAKRPYNSRNINLTCQRRTRVPWFCLKLSFSNNMPLNRPVCRWNMVELSLHRATPCRTLQRGSGGNGVEKWW